MMVVNTQCFKGNALICDKWTQEYILILLSDLTDGIINDEIYGYTVKKLSELFRLSEKTIAESLKSMEAQGVISKQVTMSFGKGPGNNCYTLNQRRDLLNHKNQNLINSELTLHNSPPLQKYIYLNLLCEADKFGVVDEFVLTKFSKSIGLSANSFKKNLNKLIKNGRVFSYLPNKKTLSAINGVKGTIYLNLSNHQETKIKLLTGVSKTLPYPKLLEYLETRTDNRMKLFLDELQLSSKVNLFHNLYRRVDLCMGDIINSMQKQRYENKISNENTIDAKEPEWYVMIKNDVFGFKPMEINSDFNEPLLLEISKSFIFYSEIRKNICSLFSNKEADESLDLIKEEIINFIFINALSFYFDLSQICLGLTEQITFVRQSNPEDSEGVEPALIALRYK